MSVKVKMEKEKSGQRERWRGVGGEEFSFISMRDGRETLLKPPRGYTHTHTHTHI